MSPSLQNRRAFLRTLTVGGIGLIAAACSSPAPAAPPTAAPASTAVPKPATAPTVAPAPTAAAAAAPAATVAPAVASAPTPAAAAAGSLATSPGYNFPTGPVTLTFQHGSDATTVKLYSEVFFPAYMKMHPNVTINHEAVPGIDQKLLVEFATNTAPTMLEANATTLQALKAKDQLDAVPPSAWGAATIDDMLNTWYLPRVMDVLKKDGQLYGIPNQMNASSLMINLRAFKAANLDPVANAPKTWDDIAKLQPLLLKKNSAGEITQKGFEFVWARPDTIDGSFQLLTYQAGGKVLEDDGMTAAFNSDAGVTALQTIKALSVDPAVTRNTAAVVQNDWSTELSAMATGGPNTGPLSETINPAMTGNYVYSDLPQLNPGAPKAVSVVFSICVNRNAPADQKAVAHDLIRFMAQQPELWLQYTGQVTPVKSLATSATAHQLMSYLDIALHDLSVALPPLVTPYGSQLDTAIKAAAERVVLQGQDPKASLDQAQSDYAQAIKS